MGNEDDPGDDVQKRLTELRNKVERERIDISSGSDVQELNTSAGEKKRRKVVNRSATKDEDVKVVTILDSDEEMTKKKKEKKKKRKRSRYVTICKLSVFYAQ